MSRPIPGPPGHLWWRHGVIYQIYPRSFMDANGDGVGDLEGIRCRLDHLQWLGVDGIWLSPIYPSPMVDFGYDVADYCEVDPSFGSLEEFDRLLAEAHARGIRVILDWVPAHTSHRHPWFIDARARRDSPKRDWYVWRDPKSDGTPPNNWCSSFGGSAWEYDEHTGQYYLHSHLAEQPDLDWRNPEVASAMHEVLRFWLERGVDGFRIDVVHRMFKDPMLRDNPLIPGRTAGSYTSQRHIHDQNHPDVHAELRRIRRLLDRYDERMAVGEVYVLDPEVVAAYYGNGDELNLAFNFLLTRNHVWEAETFRREVERFAAALPDRAWPVWVLSSHDASRHASRFDDPIWGDARARLAALFLLTTRATPFLYYGEEIGMRDVPIPHDRSCDPLGQRLEPSASRDPERTPMQWEPGPGSGFTCGEPWLPIAEDAGARNVAQQRQDRASLLWFYRDLLSLRRNSPALHRGDFEALEAPDRIFAYVRRHGTHGAVVALNFGERSHVLELGSGRPQGGLHTSFGAPLPADLSRVEVGPQQGLVLIQASASEHGEEV